MVLIGIGLIHITYHQLSTIQQPVKWDPYEILEIPENAELSVIKRAYRKLTLLYHPDKNPDERAAATFINISKAYEALTDPKIRKIYEEYGNADGPEAVKVSIAFPTILMNKDFGIQILTVFFVILFIAIPSSFLIV